tara:strand:+ start:461 stop:1240 length:780 start_codon:yes stop_codon:yes gene_type:complete
MPLGPKTLSYSEEAKGWPSFYSYIPEYMVGMNSYFYSFNGGNLFRHNTNETRNNYYNTQYNSEITAVFNTEPQTIKLFKTMSYESDDRWACTALFTELGSGSMLATEFVEKEREFFTYLRENETTINWNARSANGIGPVDVVGGATPAVTMDFVFEIGSLLSIGDYVYTSVAGVITYLGQVTAIDRDINRITYDDTVVDVQGTIGSAAVVATNYIMYMKNAVAESHGARGYFMQFTLQNTNTAAVELFSVGSSVMKSYP